MKLLNVRIIAKNIFVIFIDIVLLVNLFPLFFTAAIPSRFGMLLRENFIPIVTNIESFGMLKFMIFLMKSFEYMIYDEISLTTD